MQHLQQVLHGGRKERISCGVCLCCGLGDTLEMIPFTDPNCCNMQALLDD